MERELFNINVVEDDLAVELSGSLFHQRLEDLAWAAPGSWTLENHWGLRINYLIPLFCFCHLLNRNGFFISLFIVRAEFDPLYTTANIEWASWGWWLAGNHFPVQSYLLLLNEESTHLCSNECLALWLTNEILEKTFLDVHWAASLDIYWKIIFIIIFMVQINLLRSLLHI